MSHVHRLYQPLRGVQNGVNMTYSLPHRVNRARVFINGVEQKIDVDFKISNGTVTFAEAPEPDDVLYAHYEVPA